MRKFGRLYLLFALTMTAFLAIGASAQGRYVNQYSRADVDDIIRRVETSGDEFRRDFRNELNRSNLSSSQKRTYNNQVIDFEKATDRLRNDFNNQNSWWGSRSQVQNLISNSRPLNQTMNGIGFRRQIERQWNQLRNDVNRLADTYDLPGIAGGGWNGGPWNPGNPGGGNRPPSWAVGTWYWINGPNRQITINSDGTVTAENQGRFARGTYRNGTINFEGVISTVTRNGNRIRTYNRSSGEVSDYARNPYGGGGGGGGVSRPPSWAVGTWVWVQGSNRIMTITRDGDVRVTNQGRFAVGTYNNGVITLDGITSTVTRAGNNRIRTHNQSSGEVSDYRRQ